jgi:hypothetical protein
MVGYGDMTFQLGGFGSIPIHNRIIIIIIIIKGKKKRKKKGEPRLVKIKEEGLGGEEEDFSILCCYICGRRKI